MARTRPDDAGSGSSDSGDTDGDGDPYAGLSVDERIEKYKRLNAEESDSGESDSGSSSGSTSGGDNDRGQTSRDPLSGGTGSGSSTPDESPDDTDTGGDSSDDRQRSGSDPFGGKADSSDSSGSGGGGSDGDTGSPTPPPTTEPPDTDGSDSGSGGSSDDSRRPRPPEPPTTPDEGLDDSGTPDQPDEDTGQDTTQQIDEPPTQTIDPEQQGPTPTNQGVEEFGREDEYIFDGEKYGEGELTDQIESQLAAQNENVDPSDIEANLDNQVARIRLTDEGAEDLKGEAGEELTHFTVSTTKSAAEGVEARVVAQTDADPEDVAVLETEGGEYEVQFTEEGLAEKAAEQIAERENVDPGAVSVEDGKVVVEESGITPTQFPDTQETTVADRINPAVNKLQAAKTQQGSRVGEPPEDQETTVSDRINPAVNKLQAAEMQQGSRVGERPTRPGGIRTFEEFFKREVAKEASEETGLNVKPGDIQLDRTDEGIEASIQERERFGDIDWSFGYGGEEDEVEEAVDEAGETVSRAGQNLAEEIFKPSGVGGKSAGAEVLRAAGREDLARGYEENLRRFGKGLVGGTTAIVNVPGMVGGVMEGVEYANYATDETIEGRGGETASESIDRAVAVGQQMANQPYQSGGLLVGSLAASTAVMSTAAKVSNRAGLASRVAIQPGEEAAGYGGHLLTRTVASRRKADLLFPQKEPLIFSEEAAIRTAKAASRKGKAATKTLRGKTKLAETGPTPYRAELYGRFEPGTATETTAEEGMPGATSEPLGSQTGDILDATVGSPSRYELATEPAGTETTTTGTKQGVTAEMEEIAGEAQGRSELAQAIDEFGVDVREFAAAERGQASLTGVGRTETETETEPELEDDRVSDNLYQQAVEQQVKAEYDIRGKGTYEGVGKPFETETETEGPEGRLERAQKPQVETETDVTRRYETAVTVTPEPDVTTNTDTLGKEQPETAIDVRSHPGTETRRTTDSRLSNRIGQEIESLSRPRVDAETRADTMSETRVGLDTELETETETKTELDVESELELEYRRNFEFEQDTELELETETELEPESRPEIEGEADRGTEEPKTTASSISGFDATSGKPADRGLGAGFYSETVTALALGAGPREAPSEKKLEQLGGADTLAGRAPTKAMLSGSKEEQQQIEAAEAFLSFGEAETDGDNSDDDFWGLL